MALIKCDECQKPISANAKKCPNCGAPTQYGKNLIEKTLMVVIWLLAILALIIILWIINKQNDKIVGTWAKETSRDIFVPESLKEYPSQQFKSTTKYSYNFNDDGSCILVYEYTGGFSGNTRYSSTPCKYKLGHDEITITWLDDENDEYGEEEIMSFSYGGSYIIIDDEKYERDY